MQRVSAACGLAWSLAASAAAADEKQECIDAYVATQADRADGRLRAAREQAVVCARDVCPAALAAQCSGWLPVLAASTPSIVVTARSPDGSTLVEVGVTLDGKPLLTRLDGRAIELDPGEHRLRFEATGYVPTESRVYINEGERLRALNVTLTATALPASAPKPAAPHAIKPEAFVAGGVGVAAIAVASYFDLRGASERRSLDGCKPTCPHDDVDAAREKFVFGDIGFGVGIAAIAAATYFVLSSPSAHPPTAGAARRPGPFSFGASF